MKQLGIEVVTSGLYHKAANLYTLMQMSLKWFKYEASLCLARSCESVDQFQARPFATQATPISKIFLWHAVQQIVI